MIRTDGKPTIAWGINPPSDTQMKIAAERKRRKKEARNESFRKRQVK